MLKSIKQSVWSLILLALLPAGLSAQRFLYTNNDVVPNSISAYAIGTNGALNEITGSPFATGGDGRGANPGFNSANRIIIVNNFLYASNSGSNTISAFSIDPASGNLVPVVGSPFSTGAFNDPTQSGISLAATPDGKFLYAGSTGYDAQFNPAPITMFTIDPTTGALTVSSKSPIPAGGAMSSMKVSPDGNYLLAAIPGSNAISVFAIRGPGMLHAIHNSSYALSSEAATSIDINCSSNLVFAGGTGGDIYAFNFASGALLPVSGSPFATGLASNRVVTLSTTDSTLYSSNQSGSTVTAFAVGSNGVLAIPGTSVNAAGVATGVLPYPSGLAVSNDGQFLYAADLNSDASSPVHSGFSIFSLSGSSPLTFVSLNSTGLASGLQSLAAYPAKACTALAAPKK
ncbi:MAG TPA: beta-propeller fold lactonase family protein [Terriglobia bacterium]|nr:beta-propeller fold lactonase family protein [Terriglobia bacterium]